MVLKLCACVRGAHSQCVYVLKGLLISCEHLNCLRNLVTPATLNQYYLLNLRLQRCHQWSELYDRTENVPMSTGSHQISRQLHHVHHLCLYEIIVFRIWLFLR